MKICLLQPCISVGDMHINLDSEKDPGATDAAIRRHCAMCRDQASRQVASLPLDIFSNLPHCSQPYQVIPGKVVPGAEHLKEQVKRES